MKKILTITVALLVSMFFSQVPAATQTKPAGDPEAGKAKSASCTACHGADGNSLNPEWPKLAGQHENYLLKQMNYFTVFFGIVGFLNGVIQKWLLEGGEGSLLDEAETVREVLFYGIVAEAHENNRTSELKVIS